MRLLLTFLFAVWICSGCVAPAPNQMERVRVAPSGKGFMAGISPFVPWGFNYDRDHRMRLLEDYWEGEWGTVVEDFQEMRRLGANVVRIHLQFGQFMESPTRPKAASLNRLTKLLSLAEQEGLRLDLTGLACYRKSDVPAWYNLLNEAARWEAQANFWRAVAGVGRNSRAVFCYNLMNEPLVPGEPRAAGAWLVGELAGFWYVQAITLDPAGRDPAAVAAAWVAKLASAIRSTDSQALITVGLLPNSHQTPGSGFLPTAVGRHLDFLAVHVYPDRAKLDESLKLLDSYQVGKPVVIEEMFPLACSMAEFESFLKTTRERQQAQGWIGFYWGQTPEELEQEKTISAQLTGGWLKIFQRQRPTP